ncbi:sensor histidine kinase [Acidovorax sp. K2F]|uniref:sensor histidine kinase n=1 Tax=Acidovorax sp. K2F TaxID=2978125 RepID=UPI0021B0918E|nr:HAMP domain-containing sensor histidine kinase [Acidovorax sp. K2F]MCT6718015.1 HAMP domain-containing histidine kinase [Acidovorax sp. K2F]
MKLDRFLNEHIEEILSEWEDFSLTLVPEASTSHLALRNYARGMLQAIALDIETVQNPEEQYQKSRGNAPRLVGAVQTAASSHGGQRQAHDFSLLQLCAEFRALRATVLRLWLPRVGAMTEVISNQMVRFNESIDQAQAEAVVTYSSKADQTRELFLAILGHDLRMPLFSMRLAGERLKRADLSAAEIAETGDRIRSGTRLMNSMVADLLGYTRTQLGSGMPIVPAFVDVHTVCESALEDARAAHPLNSFELQITGNTTGVFDGVRLHQLFANLLFNAAQYGDRDRPVVIGVHGEANGINVQVINHGQPIPAASLIAIFKPLVQLPEDGIQDERPRTSLGLGLFVAREIAEAHGGSIEVQSDAERGTVFTVQLPARQGAKN